MRVATAWLTPRTCPSVIRRTFRPRNCARVLLPAVPSALSSSAFRHALAAVGVGSFCVVWASGSNASCWIARTKTSVAALSPSSRAILSSPPRFSSVHDRIVALNHVARYRARRRFRVWSTFWVSLAAPTTNASVLRRARVLETSFRDWTRRWARTPVRARKRCTPWNVYLKSPSVS